MNEWIFFAFRPLQSQTNIPGLKHLDKHSYRIMKRQVKVSLISLKIINLFFSFWFMMIRFFHFSTRLSSVEIPRSLNSNLHLSFYRVIKLKLHKACFLIEWKQPLLCQKLSDFLAVSIVRYRCKTFCWQFESHLGSSCLFKEFHFVAEN